MSCCGGHRAAQRTSYQSLPGAARGRASAGASARGSVPVKHVTFEFNGAAPIVVTGPATGATYRFSAKGARLSVHGSDAPSLVSVPGLRPVL
ncbi:MAG TPA: hypothetical protein VGE83_03500 [Terracidiphilus sp.]|jgi:hypothetical protein